MRCCYHSVAVILLHSLCCYQFCCGYSVAFFLYSVAIILFITFFVLQTFCCIYFVAIHSVATILLQLFCCNPFCCNHSVAVILLQSILLQPFCCSYFVAIHSVTNICCNGSVASILLHSFCCYPFCCDYFIAFFLHSVAIILLHSFLLHIFCCSHSVVRCCRSHGFQDSCPTGSSTARGRYLQHLHPLTASTHPLSLRHRPLRIN